MSRLIGIIASLIVSQWYVHKILKLLQKLLTNYFLRFYLAFLAWDIPIAKNVVVWDEGKLPNDRYVSGWDVRAR